MKDSILFNKERRQKILDIIHRGGSVNVNDLAAYFHVTPATIRADLSHLEAEGALVRTHGGAIANIPNRREPRINERYNEEKKNRIADKAVELVEERDILLLDTGTTMVSFAKALVNSPITELTVYSNDIDVIRILEEKESFSLHLFAGKMRNGYHYCYGSLMSQFLQNCHFNRLFLSSSAVSVEHGLTTANPELAQIKKEMIASSDEIILLVDSSKLHHVDFQKFADLKQVDVLVMDSEITEEDSNVLETSVKNMILA